MKVSLQLWCFTVMILVGGILGFSPRKPGVLQTRSPKRFRFQSLKMGFFDNAFKNDPAYAKKPAAAGKAASTVSVTFDGRKTVQAAPGTSLEQVARNARVNIPFNCKNGKCGTCEVLLDDSRVIRTCQTKVAKKDMRITTK